MSKMNDLMDEYKELGYSVACIISPPGDDDIEYRVIVEDPEIEQIDNLLGAIDEVIDILKKRKMELLLEK